MLDAPLSAQTQQYFNQVLGGNAVVLKPLETPLGLPYFLQDGYDTVEAQIHGHRVALTCIKSRKRAPAQQLAHQIGRLRELLKIPVIVTLPAITPGERKQLIEHEIQFVVPGQQLYAPQLGMILSEKYPVQVKREVDYLSPSTQALLVWFLLHHPANEVWHPFDDAAALGYAAMTATRAIREFVQFDLFKLEQRGRGKFLKLELTRRDIWEKAKPHLRSPVQRTLRTYDRNVLTAQGALLAGESALAETTMLNAPPQPVIALPSGALAACKLAGITFEPTGVSGAVTVQIWRYGPAMQVNTKTVDPLSLWLSTIDDTDERLQLVRDELEGAFPW